MNKLHNFVPTKFEFDVSDELEKKLSEEWVILSYLGKGGFGLVISAYGKKIGCIRAIKVRFWGFGLGYSKSRYWKKRDSQVRL